MMHVLNICQCTNLGGMEQSSLHLMKGLQQRGHSFEVLSLNPLGAMKPLLDEAGIPARGLLYQGRGGWRSFAQIRTNLRAVRADAVLMTGPHLLTMLAMGKHFPRPRVLGIHFHHRGVKPDWQWRLIYRQACRQFEAVVFPSDFIQREALEIYPLLQGRSHIIRYPVVLPELPNAAQRLEARRQLGLPLEAPVVGNAGWLIPRKRWDIFLETAARIIARQPATRFVIAGDGPLHHELQSLAERLGLQERVTWLGWRESLGIFYQSLDALLFNSDWDAMGLTALEAMSYGVPVAASVQQGGLKEVIVDDRFGRLLPNHDIAALANQIVHWLENSKEARYIGLQGRQRVDEMGDPNSVAAAYEKLFEPAARAIGVS